MCALSWKLGGQRFRDSGEVGAEVGAKAGEEVGKPTMGPHGDSSRRMRGKTLSVQELGAEQAEFIPGGGGDPSLR